MPLTKKNRCNSVVAIFTLTMLISSCLTSALPKKVCDDYRDLIINHNSVFSEAINDIWSAYDLGYRNLSLTGAVGGVLSFSKVSDRGIFNDVHYLSPNSSETELGRIGLFMNDMGFKALFFNGNNYFDLKINSNVDRYVALRNYCCLDSDSIDAALTKQYSLQTDDRFYCKLSSKWYLISERVNL